MCNPDKLRKLCLLTLAKSVEDFRVCIIHRNKFSKYIFFTIFEEPLIYHISGFVETPFFRNQKFCFGLENSFEWV